ncbi:hypothetical protein B0H19DRAFT_1349895 [Mycena capillaripes]|nr:hypothetical protein B0H19DRAFT_1349895 [Mycena capillaripes]
MSSHRGNSRIPKLSVLQALLNGLLTPPATQLHRDEGSHGNGQRWKTGNNRQTVWHPSGPRQMAAHREYHDPEPHAAAADESQEQSAAIFKQTYNILDDIGEVEDAEVRLRVMTSQDHCKYNLTTAEEVAIILPSDGSEGDGRDIILRNPTPLMHHYSDTFHDHGPAPATPKAEEIPTRLVTTGNPARPKLTGFFGTCAKLRNRRVRR